MIGSILICGLLGTVYTLIEAFTGASPGKRVMGMQIAKADGTAGRRCTCSAGTQEQRKHPELHPAHDRRLVSTVFFFGCFAALDSMPCTTSSPNRRSTRRRTSPPEPGQRLGKDVAEADRRSSSGG